MKNLKRLLLITIITLGFTTIQAQNKVAHIDTQALIESMPETKAMNTFLEKLSQTYDNDLKAAQTAAQAKLEKYNAEAATQTAEENQKRTIEVDAERQKLYAAAQSAQQDLQSKRNEKLAPIVEKAQKAIQDIAATQGIDYVFDSSALLVATGTDIMAAVKSKLGI